MPAASMPSREARLCAGTTRSSRVIAVALTCMLLCWTHDRPSMSQRTQRSLSYAWCWHTLMTNTTARRRPCCAAAECRVPACMLTSLLLRWTRAVTSAHSTALAPSAGHVMSFGRQAALAEDIRQLMAAWKQHLATAARIIIQAPSSSAGTAWLSHGTMRVYKASAAI